VGIQPRKLECSLSSVTEALAEVLAHGRELEALSAWDLHGLLRMRQVVQIKRAQMDFEHFRKSLALELTNLHTSLSEALSIVTEAREMTSSTGEGSFQSLAPTTRAI